MMHGFNLGGRLSVAIVCGALVVSCSVRVAAAQEPRFAYPIAADAVTVSKDLAYGDGLHMDVYRPARSAAGLPAIVFFNLATGADRAVYDGWARVAASHGLVAVLPDLREETTATDLGALLAYLPAHAATLGLDADAIVLYAASGNVWRALPIIEDPTLTAIKAAVMYYGAAEVKALRPDLPVLFVRAGLDRPAVNHEMDGLIARALTQNVPVTVINNPAGYHAFEFRDDDGATRAVIEGTIDYVKRVTAPPYQAALRNGVREATAAADVSSGRFDKAAAEYAELVAARPADTTLRLAYGEALLGDRQYAAACDELEKLRNKQLGPRDLGLPAARACVQNGDAERAIGWLRSIPRRLLPDEVQNEAAFAPIRDRADFKAVFEAK